MRYLLTTTIAFLLIHALPLQAHHSFATHYDSTNIVEISGTIIEIKIRSPHSFFTVQVTNEDGSVEDWAVESHARALLDRVGITSEVIQLGDPITIWGPRSRKPERFLLFGSNYLTAGGGEFEILKAFRRPPENSIADTREGVTGLDRFAGRWITYIEGQAVTDSPMPLNEAGLAARAAFDSRDTPAMNCVPPNLPAAFFLPYNYDITIDGNEMVLHQEYQDIRREVTVGPDVPDTTLPDFGHRKARLEGATLVITSNNFPALRAGLATGFEPNGNGADIPSSTRKTLVERYTVNEDGSQLIMAYTVDDPEYLRESYTSQITWHRVPMDGPQNDIGCDREIATRSTLNAVRESE